MPPEDQREKGVIYVNAIPIEYNRVRIINPEDEEYSFGINPLSCNDLTSLKERTDTYTPGL